MLEARPRLPEMMGRIKLRDYKHGCKYGQGIYSDLHFIRWHWKKLAHLKNEHMLTGLPIVSRGDPSSKALAKTCSCRLFEFQLHAGDLRLRSGFGCLQQCGKM